MYTGVGDAYFDATYARPAGSFEKYFADCGRVRRDLNADPRLRLTAAACAVSAAPPAGWSRDHWNAFCAQTKRCLLRGGSAETAAHGVGEYFGANGLGEFFVPTSGLGEMAPLTDDEKKDLAMYAGGGVVAGLLVATMMKKTKTSGLLTGGGLGAALGLGAFYAMRKPAA